MVVAVPCEMRAIASVALRMTGRYELSKALAASPAIAAAWLLKAAAPSVVDRAVTASTPAMPGRCAAWSNVLLRSVSLTIIPVRLSFAVLSLMIVPTKLRHIVGLIEAFSLHRWNDVAANPSEQVVAHPLFVNGTTTTTNELCQCLVANGTGLHLFSGNQAKAGQLSQLAFLEAFTSQGSNCRFYATDAPVPEASFNNRIACNMRSSMANLATFRLRMASRTNWPVNSFPTDGAIWIRVSKNLVARLGSKLPRRASLRRPALSPAFTKFMLDFRRGFYRLALSHHEPDHGLQ